jgi:hypothetical protein
MGRGGAEPLSQSSQASVVDVSLKEQKEMLDTYSKLREGEAKLVGPDGRAEILPNNLILILASVAG